MNMEDGRLIARFQRLTTELVIEKRLGRRRPELTDELYQTWLEVDQRGLKETPEYRNVMKRADRHAVWLAGLVMLSKPDAAPPLCSKEHSLSPQINKQTCRWRLVGAADEVFRSGQRQAIATALKETARPMSVNEIMAATERRDRNATEVLLHRMEKAGEVKHAGRGQWMHPDIESHPAESSKIGKKVRNDNQTADNQQKSGADKSYRNLTDDESSKIASKIQSFDKPLVNNVGSPESYNLTDLTGSDGGNGQSHWPPALGPEGDDVFDLDLSWRQRGFTTAPSSANTP